MITGIDLADGESKQVSGVFIKVDQQHQVITNCPHLVKHHAADGGFSVNYGGSGPADFALNIIEWALKRRGYTEPEEELVELYEGKCFHRAWRLHQDFKWEFLTSVPVTGKVITFDEIYEWIDKRGERVDE